MTKRSQNTYAKLSPLCPAVVDTTFENRFTGITHTFSPEVAVAVYFVLNEPGAPMKNVSLKDRKRWLALWQAARVLVQTEDMDGYYKILD